MDLETLDEQARRRGEIPSFEGNPFKLKRKEIWVKKQNVKLFLNFILTNFMPTIKQNRIAGYDNLFYPIFFILPTRPNMYFYFNLKFKLNNFLFY